MNEWIAGLPLPVALGAVALIGYLFGSFRKARNIEHTSSARRELKRAKAVIKELEAVAKEIRRSLAVHHGSVLRFKERVGQLGTPADQTAWQELSEEAEQLLKPTLALATQIAHSYDHLRQQTNLLMTFTEVRTDPLTGLSNRRALDESLATMFAVMSRYGNTFSVAIFDLDHFKKINDEQGHLAGDNILKEAGKLLDDAARDTDIVTRFGGEEFVVIMPETPLEGACVFAERVREVAAAKLPCTISGGVAAAIDGDNPRTILSRADSALYSAKSAGRNQIYRHSGLQIEPVIKGAVLTTAAQPVATAQPAAVAKPASAAEPADQVAKATAATSTSPSATAAEKSEGDAVTSVAK